MNSQHALTADQLYQPCDPAQFNFTTTADLPDLSEIIGQDRALSAIRFGIGIPHEGYNLYALGPNGTGKLTAVSQFLKQKSSSEPNPDDWCYVYDFDKPHQPKALRLPAGKAIPLQEDMKQLVQDLTTVLPTAFTSEEYEAQKKSVQEEIKQQQIHALNQVKENAEAQEIALIQTPNGFAFAPLKDGDVINPEDFLHLPAEKQDEIERNIQDLQEQLQKIMRQIPQWQREAHKRLTKLNEEVTTFTIAPLFKELRQKYSDHENVLEYLTAVEKNVIESINEFIQTEADSPLAEMMGSGQGGQQPAFKRYQINVMVDHSGDEGAPVVYEDQPTFTNLIGRVEHISQMGTMVTDFTLIKPGALHRANGGYLVLDARKLLMQGYAWEGLKQALRSQQIRIESLAQILSLISTITLEPEPIPLNVKVVLLGERRLYYLLYQYDPDFGELFKVTADFEDQMVRDEKSHQAYAELIGTLARKEGLRHFDPPAVARVIEYSARLAADAERLSMHMQSISDLLREASYCAEQAGREVAGVADVEQALQAQVYRNGRIQDLMQENILRDTLFIDTAGEVVGQINGLAVLQLGNYMFGKPNRITARVKLGKGEVVDIERQVEMGGPLHSKGVLILASFLGGRYGADQPLALSASLVFEQSYGGVDGDSASSAELYALLSALADAPIKQSLAVTGSVNQRGQVQPIGGVNEKIEGFFDLCVARGLTGEQGVLIPQSNVKHLMLKPEVVTAVAEQQFHIYAIQHIDEGIEILTGIPAGSPDESGDYPPESINGRIMAKLAHLTARQRAFATPLKKEKVDADEDEK